MTEPVGAATGGPALLDLGVMEGPALLFGGAYSNLHATQAMLAVARDTLHIPASRTIHTGDVVAYCAQPRETAELLRASGVVCLMGNCEESVGVGKNDCGCGFPEDSTCNAYSVNWYAHVMKELQGHASLAAWMGALPRRIEFVLSGRRLAVVHGSPRGISEFVWPSTSDAELRDCFAKLPEGIDGVISGHSGIPYARLVPWTNGTRTLQKLWLNAGVIGVPANDGTPRVWYAVLTPVGNGGIEVSLRALAYDVQAAAEAIYARPQLVRGYADSLLSGVWPSHDVLPLEEQMNTGVPLEERTLLWPLEAPKGQELSCCNPAEALMARPAVAAAATAALALGLAAAWSLRARCLARAPP